MSDTQSTPFADVTVASEASSPHWRTSVAAQAGSGEVLVSQTVKELVAGSGLEFGERGEHELKGVPGSWRLYAVADTP